VPSMCNIVHYSSSYSFVGHMFRPNWPSSGVQMVMDSAAHCNAVFFPPITCIVASGYFGYVLPSV
jgi:hypothetical protein